jgi:hypothetical protein
MNIPVENQIPLIWTSKGNLPEDDLRMEVQWFVEPGSHIKVVKRHYLGDELVKEGADILSLNGVTGEAVINDPR